MQSVLEIFEYSHPLNIRIFLHKVNAVAMHWHPAYEFLMILEGDCSITTDITREYRENDLVLINAYEPHSVLSRSGAVMLALQVSDSVFGTDGGISVDSVRYPDSDYTGIKSIMAHLIKLHSEKKQNCEILMQSLILRLKYELVSNFRADAEGAEKFDRYRKHISKLSGVLDYIKANYHTEISLGKTAAEFFFSPAYLSRLFEKTMGITFKKYVDSLRFTEAMNLLLSTAKSIDEVASQSGFPNPRAFVTMHKEIYGILPSEHRKRSADDPDPLAEPAMNYVDFKKTDYLSKLAVFLDDAENTVIPQIRSGTDTFRLEFDTANPTATLRHTERNFCCVGRAADLLRENIRGMLTEAQREIGFRYIKFHGLFDDELSVYTVTTDGRRIINFDNIDRIIDFLLSIRLKPLLQLSFMPRALAKYPAKTTFFRPLVTSEPRSYEEWADFIRRFVQHLLSRYSREEVDQWLFSLWNEAETPPSMFGFYDPSVFPEFYRVTYHAVKDICPEIRFGTASVMFETLLGHDWFQTTYGALPDCPPDFINLHFYPVKTSVTYDINHLESSSIELHTDPDILSKTITEVRERLTSLGYGELPIYLTEWNSTTSHRDLLNDTAFKGTYVVHNILENYDRLDSFGYWSLTDDIYELPADDRLFHGGHGLFTKSGIKKPPYYAFSFLSQLGDKLVGKSRDMIVTEDARGFQMVFANYIQYNELYAAGELFDTNPDNRYAAFPSENVRVYDISLQNVIPGVYLIEEYIVNRENGSTFDIWTERFHNQEPITMGAMNALQQASFPKYCMNKITVEQSTLNYHVELAPHEIRLVLMKRL